MTTSIVKRSEVKELTAQYERQTMEQVAMATAWANQLLKVVEAKKLYAVIEGKRYLQFEAWGLIAAFDHTHFESEWIHEIVNTDNEIIGYLARVHLTREGVVIGAGEMSCGLDEFPCRGKEGMAKNKAAMSAAQTWAASKAARLNYSYVAVLAGFEPTPAEEMSQPVPIAIGNSKPPYGNGAGELCPIHNLVFAEFSRDGRTWCAHSYMERDQKKWCNGNDRVVMEALMPSETHQDAPEEASDPSDLFPPRETPADASFKEDESGQDPGAQAKLWDLPERRIAFANWAMDEYHLNLVQVLTKVGIGSLIELKDEADIKKVVAKLRAVEKR